MVTAHNLGFPRIGLRRGLKKAVESFWNGKISQEELEKISQEIQIEIWKIQAKAGIDLIPVGDFSYYDHMLDMSALLGVIPERFRCSDKSFDLNTYFCMARGQAPNGQEAHACEMTKWFDTNYHYIVPELTAEQQFCITSEKLFHSIKLAVQQGHQVKPVLVGPLTFLWLSKIKGQDFDKLNLLSKLIPVYNEVIARLQQQNIQYLQIDEPILGLDLPESWKEAFLTTYQQLNFGQIKAITATYFSALGNNLELACQLPVSGLHIDAVIDQDQIEAVLNQLPTNKLLSIGIVNGRNIWKTNLSLAFNILKKVKDKIGDRLWIAPSCSLLHSPVDLDTEHQLNPEIKNWLAFSKQKVEEIALLAKGLNQGEGSIIADLESNQKAISSRKNSKLIHKASVQENISSLNSNSDKRQSNFSKRVLKQSQALKLPLFPTTTIGSFPQTESIRHTRMEFKTGKINQQTYEQRIKLEIADAVKRQEEMELDVLVHGEAERNDMVEYFGELLEGFAFTQNGWVQSYGSRCVKPPIIFGDVSRKEAMTVAWSQYAQSLTQRHMKGMLTGPVTILAWSFVRDDQPEADTALQIALALREEVIDLEQAGIKVIQIDEPAFRELLPLRKKDWNQYLQWAAKCFRISASGVKDETQIHTHMCYSEFNDIIEAIASLDADVITLESSRSDMELLKAFENFDYPNEIGPGVYDIHSPRIPSTEEVLTLLQKALQYLPKERLWVNPDCGLKTRGWKEVTIALRNMVAAAQTLRKNTSDLKKTETEATVN